MFNHDKSIQIIAINRDRFKVERKTNLYLKSPEIQFVVSGAVTPRNNSLGLTCTQWQFLEESGNRMVTSFGPFGFHGIFSVVVSTSKTRPKSYASKDYGPGLFSRRGIAIKRHKMGLFFNDWSCNIRYLAILPMALFL